MEKVKTVKLSNGVEIVNCTPHRLIFEDGTIAEPCGLLLQARMIENIITTVPVTIAEVKIAPTPEGEQELSFLEKEFPGVIILGSAISAQAYPGRVKMVILTQARADVSNKVCRIDKFLIYPKD